MDKQKIVIAGQRPKTRFVAGMDRGSPTRVKWGFMKDSKGMFDTYQLSLRIWNFDNLKGVEV